MSFGNTPKDAALIPMSSVYVPGTVNPIALQGANITTDGLGNQSASVCLILLDGSFVGTVTADGDTVALALPGGQSTALVQITGTFVGTLLFEASPDNGTNWYPVMGSQAGTSTTATSTTSTGVWRVGIAGFTTFHVKLHPVTSGTAAINVRLSSGVHNVFVNNSLTIANATALGQAVMAGSSPVALASDQPGLSQMASRDGLAPTAVLAEGMYIYSAGGPVDSTGKAQQASLDRVKSLQGAGLVGSTGNITTTVAGDANLVFGAAPKTIMPGQKIQLSVGTAAPVETVIVSSSYVPSSTATTIPLQFPVVNASSTSAKWDQYVTAGVQGAVGILPIDIPLCAPVMQDATSNSSVYYLPANAGADSGSVLKYLEHAIGLYNGTNLDRQRGNLDNISLVASAAYTTTQTPADQTNYNARGVVVCVDTTVVPGTAPSNVVTISGKDPVSGKYNTLLTGAAITAVGTVFYTIYPGATAAANLTVSLPLPRTWQVKVTAGNANSATYSVAASYIL